MAAAEQDVREATDRFYDALNRLLGQSDPGPMLALWSREPEISAMHPDGARFIGWDEVRTVMENWARSVTNGQITPAELRFHVVGDVAVVTGWERAQGTIAAEVIPIDGRVTLVLRREADGWKIIHHHVDMVAALRAAVQRVMAQAGGRG